MSKSASETFACNFTHDVSAWLTACESQQQVMALLMLQQGRLIMQLEAIT